MMHESQWRSQGSQSGGDKQPRSQAAPKARTLYGGGGGPGTEGMLPRENFEIQSL